MPTQVEAAKSVAKDRFQAAEQALFSLSHRIHAEPELGFQEEKACAWLCEALDGAGLAVEKNLAGIGTAFRARVGSGSLHLAICAEYDALPGIGHACGHNVIAASAVGAALALFPLVDDLGLTVDVVGTPAEEGGGGKILLLEKGVFADAHAAMIVHPAPMDIVTPRILAALQFDVHYHGKEAHASAFPEFGINAADAMTVAQTAIGLLRQHLCSTDRVHGFVTKGGDAPNVIPAHTSAAYMVRARSLADLEEVDGKVRRCFEAGALATGSKLEIQPTSPAYAEMEHDAEIAALYQRNAETLGRRFPDLGIVADRAAGSTDMGNVSLALPSIHPFIGIESLPAVNHQPEFTAHCVKPAADRALVDGALAMAWTAIDLATNTRSRSRLLERSRDRQ